MKLTPALLLAVVLATGCKKDGANSGNGAAATQPASTVGSPPATAPGAATAFKVPEVGKRYVTREEYKPVPGKYGGRLVRSSLSEPKSFNPIVASETSTTDYTIRMCQGLVETDAFTGETKPLLAEKWGVSEDGLTWTFHLRKDVTFNDGSPFTAHDVAFTWNDLVHDSTRPEGKPHRWPSSARDATTFDGKPIRLEVVDDYTVKVIAPVKVAIMDQLMGTPFILSKKKYAPMVADGSFGGAMSADAKPQDLVGTGPWILGQYARGQWVVLRKNPNYWRKDEAGNKLPYMDELAFLIAKDYNTMLLHFQQKSSDLFQCFNGNHVAVLRPKQQEEDFTLYQLGPDFGDVFCAFNQNSEAVEAGRFPKDQGYKIGWFRDTRFRQAVAYAINKGVIINNVLRRLGYPIGATYTLAEGPFKYDEFGPYPYDPQKAKTLLREMGLYDRNGDGVIEDAQGHKVSFTINTNSGNANREQICDFIRSDLKAIGMEVNTLFIEFNLMVDKIQVRHDWECFVYGLTGVDDPHWGSNVYKSSGRLHMWWPNQKAPSHDWEKRIDEIMFQGIQEMDKTKRKELYRDLVRILHQQQPFVELYSTERVVALRNKFGNVFPPPGPGQAQNIIVHNEEEIFVK